MRGVISVAPLAGCGSRFDQRSKPMSVEELGANAGVERFDVRVLRRFSGLDEEQFHVVLFRTLLHYF
jgi:hypothetical protein